MQVRNLELDEVNRVSNKILSNNFIMSARPIDIESCDICGNKHSDYYSYKDGYNHLRCICGFCALINISFLGGDFRINDLNTGFLILDPINLSITIITNSINTQHASKNQIVDVEWIECKSNIYLCLKRWLSVQNDIKSKRYIIQLGKRMHNYVHTTKASYGNYIHVATEQSGCHLSLKDMDKR